MFVHEAIKARTEAKPFITRTAWKVHRSSLSQEYVRLLPTNTPDCCILFSSCSGKIPCRGWQPTEEDLAADDWEIV